MKTFKMISGPKKLLFFLLSTLVLFAACKKDSDPASHQPPITESLPVSAAKAGDTIRIKGTNFSTDVAQNKVSFNGVAGKVVSASESEIVVVVPEGATTGNITITVHENTVQAGSLIINPFTFYSVKSTNVSGNYTYELVAINPATSTVSTVLNLSELPNNFTFGNFLYLPTTNELVGIDHSQQIFKKINLATKQTTSFTLSTNPLTSYEDLALDKSGNLYTVGFERNGQNATSTITKIDPATGKTTPVAIFKEMFIGFTYIPNTNELVGVSGPLLMKYNLTTKDTSSLSIPTTGTITYWDLAADNKSNMYGIKTFYDGTTSSKIVKLDAATGAETVVTTLNGSEPMYDLSFVPELNEIIGIYKNTSIYRYNLGANTSTLTEITTAPNVRFSNLISN